MNKENLLLNEIPKKTEDVFKSNPDKIKLYESENKLIRQQMLEKEKSFNQELKEIKAKLLNEIQSSNDKDLSNRMKMKQIEEERKKIEREYADLVSKFEKLEKTKGNCENLNEENSILKKQVKCLEIEKERHINQNSIEKENFIMKQEENQKITKELNLKIEELKFQKKESESNFQRMFQEHTNALKSKENESNKIKALEQQIVDLMKKNKILETNNLNFSSQISTIKNQVTFFEKMKGRLEEENKYNKKIINHMTELNEDIINYLRKDGTPNINFYVKEIVTRHKRMNPSLPLPDDSRRNLSSSKRSTFSRSKSNKKLLKIEDLNQSKFSENNSANKRCSLLINTSLTEKHRNKNFPVSAERNPKKNSSKKKSNNKKTEKSFHLCSNQDETAFPCPKWENEKIYNYYEVLKKIEKEKGEEKMVATKLNFFEEKIIENAGKDEEIMKNIVERKTICASFNDFELSNEIFELERSLTDTKREYKTLLAKSKNEDSSSTNCRKILNEKVKLIEQQTEFLIHLKKIQKERISKSTMI